MGIIILFTPTPGGAGFAEAMFNNFLGEFTPAGLSSALGTLWRFISYYPYLFIGAILYRVGSAAALPRKKSPDFLLPGMTFGKLI
jgi:uncharacterized membrane protein YbhN (UPF0104 family)